MDYNKYRQSRDVAWKILIECNVTTLPVKITSICKKYNIPVISYSHAHHFFSDNQLSRMCEGKDGFTFRQGNEHWIFYNDTCTHQRSRFTIAHELGHILLGHLSIGDKTNCAYTLINREPSPGDSPQENQANVFASRVLSPSCVLWGLNVKRAEEIVQFCDIGYQSAKFRMERMRELYKREQGFIKSTGHSCFLISDLEREVFTQFQPYIEKYHL